MPSLRELQRAFARELMNEPGAGISADILGNGFSPGQRLQVYRNNVRVGFGKTLRAAYPVIERLVGEDFFRYAADRYLRRHPSNSGNLHDFGAAFPEFLAAFEPTAAMAYLPDVARLEWCQHEVFHEADHPPLDLAALGAVPAERHEALVFSLHPASRLLASSYPVLRIWQVNQHGYDGDLRVDIAEGGVRLLVIRRQLETEIESLQAGEHALLQAFAEGLDFARACERALSVQPDLDVASSFRRHVARRTLVDFTL